MKVNLIPILLICLTAQAETNIFETIEPLTKPIGEAGAAFGKELGNYITEANNYQIKAKQYKYKGYDLNFEHQRWHIIHKSVCSNYSERITAFSNCQVAAKSFFKEVCGYMNNLKNKNNKQIRMNSMYCESAKNFKPSIAKISKPKELSDIEQAKTECNSLIAEEMGSSDPFIKAKREKACNKYQELKIVTKN